jgi:hypothetical protein
VDGAVGRDRLRRDAAGRDGRRRSRRLQVGAEQPAAQFELCQARGLADHAGHGHRLGAELLQAEPDGDQQDAQDDQDGDGAVAQAVGAPALSLGDAADGGAGAAAGAAGQAHVDGGVPGDGGVVGRAQHVAHASAARRAHGGGELGGAGVAAGRVGLGRVPDGGVDALRDAGDDQRRRRHPAGQVLGDDGVLVAGERRPAGEALVGHHAEGVDVGAPVDRAAVEQLGGEVLGGAGQRGVAGHVRRPHQPEVGHLDGVVGEQDVLGLHVEVGDAGPVGVLERLGDAADQLGGGLHVQPADPVQQVPQGLAADVLHHDPGQPAVLAGVVDGDDVGVGEAGGGERLAPELLGEGPVAGELGAGDLDRDHAVELPVVGAVDDRHAAAGDLGDDLVAPAEGPAHQVVDVDQVLCHANPVPLGGRVVGSAGAGEL